MGMPLTEFVLETVIRDGLGDLRNNPSKLDDLFSQFLQSQFINQYGQTQIDRLKTYIQSNQIRIVHAWAQVPMTVPCFSIQMTRSDEEESLQQLGNEYEDDDRDTTPTVKFPVITPGTYDTVTGKLTVINAVDLSGLCPGWIFIDADNAPFEIKTGNSNLSGNKFINIGSGNVPSLAGNGRIESNINKFRMERRMIRLKETVSIGCHSTNDVHITKYLYYILRYILKSRQDSLIARGIHLDKGIGGVFDRADEFKSENVFSRFMDISCITEFDWDQSEATLIDCFDTTIKTPFPDVNSPNAVKYNTSDD